MSSTAPPAKQLSPTPLPSEHPFLGTQSSSPLRVTCYGSSSSKTPTPYLQQAFDLGYLLATRGHTCVNGAGSFGCMSAMNDGAVLGNGHIVGVIHEMWLVDQADWSELDAFYGELETTRLELCKYVDMLATIAGVEPTSE